MASATYTVLLLSSFVFRVLAQLDWVVSLPGHSPLFVYEPYGDGDASGGWGVWSSIKGFNKRPESLAEGDIYSVTYSPGALFRLAFFGTGITVFGSANCSFHMTLDDIGRDVDKPESDTILFSTTGLGLQQHVVEVVVDITYPDQRFAVKGADIATRSPTAFEIAHYSFYDDAIQYQPKDAWATNTDQSDGAWMTTNHNRASASLSNITNARAIAVYSPLVWGHDVFGVELDGTIVRPPGKESFNSSTYFYIPNTTLFFQDGLDPNQEHSIRIVNLGDAPDVNMTVTSIEVWHVLGNPPTHTTESNTSATPSSGSVGDPQPHSGISTVIYAGITVGVLSGVIVVAAVIWLVLRACRSARGPLLTPFENVQQTIPATGGGQTKCLMNLESPTRESVRANMNSMDGTQPFAANLSPISATLNQTSHDARPPSYATGQAKLNP